MRLSNIGTETGIQIALDTQLGPDKVEIVRQINEVNEIISKIDTLLGDIARNEEYLIELSSTELSLRKEIFDYNKDAKIEGMTDNEIIRLETITEDLTNIYNQYRNIKNKISRDKGLLESLKSTLSNFEEKVLKLACENLRTKPTDREVTDFQYNMATFSGLQDFILGPIGFLQSFNQILQELSIQSVDIDEWVAKLKPSDDNLAKRHHELASYLASGLEEGSKRGIIDGIFGSFPQLIEDDIEFISLADLHAFRAMYSGGLLEKIIGYTKQNLEFVPTVEVLAMKIRYQQSDDIPTVYDFRKLLNWITNNAIARQVINYSSEEKTRLLANGKEVSYFDYFAILQGELLSDDFLSTARINNQMHTEFVLGNKQHIADTIKREDETGDEELLQEYLAKRKKTKSIPIGNDNGRSVFPPIMDINDELLGLQSANGTELGSLITTLNNRIFNGKLVNTSGQLLDPQYLQAYVEFIQNYREIVKRFGIAALSKSDYSIYELVSGQEPVEIES